MGTGDPHFSEGGSAEQLIGALLMEQDDVWSTGRRSFDMTEDWAWK